MLRSSIRENIDDALFEYNISKADALRYCLLEIPNDDIVEIMKSQLKTNDLKDIVNKLNKE